MAIAYKSAGTGSTVEVGTGVLEPRCPVVVDANDILILHCAFEGTVTAPDAPSGWTLIANAIDVGGLYRHWIFAKLADGTEGGTFIVCGFPDVSTYRTARIYSFSGWEFGTITQNIGTVATTYHATDPVMPNVTTLGAGHLAIACIFQADDNTMGSPTGVTGGTWTQRALYEQLATTPDSALALYDCTPTANPGTVSGGTISTQNDPTGSIGFPIGYLNVAPNAPTLTAPNDLATGQSITPTLSFNATDTESDTLEYEVQVDTLNTFDSVNLIVDELITDNNSINVTTFYDSWGVSFTGNGGKINTIYFKLKASTLPPNTNIYAEIYSFQGTYGSTCGAVTLLAKSYPRQTDELTTIFEWYKFELPTDFQTVNGTYYVVSIYLVLDSGNIQIASDSTKTIHDGSACYGSSEIPSADYTGSDPLFKVSESKPLIKADSATDAGFTAGHPYASGASVSYTVQTALANETTYYWRTQAIDPLGTNTYGAYSAIRSFTTELSGIPTQGSTHSHTTDNVVLTGLGVIALTTAQTVHSQTADNVTLSIVVNLAPQGSTHNHLADAVIVTPKYSLIVAGSNHNHTVEAVVLVPKYILSSNQTVHSQTTDNVSIAVKYIVTINDAVHSHLVDAVIVAPKYSLAPQGSTHAHLTDNVVLQAFSLDSSSHSHIADNVILTNLGVISLNSFDVWHNHYTENVVLIQDFQAVVQESNHNHTTENIIVAPKYTLVANDSTHTNVSDAITLAGLGLITLSSAETLHTQLTDGNLALTLRKILVVSDSLHTLFSDRVVTTKPIPATLNALYPFNVDQNGWVVTGDGKSTGYWQSTGGNLLGCFVLESIGRNNTGTTFIELTTTWEALGIAPGSVVTSITLPKLDWRVSFVNVSNGGGIGAFELLDSGGALQGTFFAQEAFTGVVTNWVTKTGSTVAVPSGLQASGTTVKFRISALLNNGNDASAQTNVLLDNVDFTVNYDGGSVNLTLPIWDSLHNHIAESPAIEVAQSVSLIVAGNTHTHNADSVILSSAYSLVPNDTLHAQTALNTDLAEHNIAVVQESLHAHSSENTILAPKYNLTVQEVSHSHTTENLDLQEGNVAIVQESAHSHSVDNVVVVVKYSLVVQDGAHNQTTDNVVLEAGIVLIVAESSHSQISESPVLSTKYNLIVADTVHNHLAENTDLQEGNVAVVQESFHSHLADNVVFATVKYSLAVQDNNHSHSAGNVIVEPKYSLSANDTLHTNIADSPVVTVAFDLLVNGANHSQIADNVKLGTDGFLAPDDGNHIQSTDNVVLTDKYQLVVNDGNHILSSDNTVVVYNLTAEVQGASHNQTAENIILIQDWHLVVTDSNHSIGSDSPDISPKYDLVAQGSDHIQSAENVAVSSKYGLTANDGLHQQVIDNIILNRHLTINSSVHSLISENVGIIRTYHLTVQDGVNGQNAENVELVLNYDFTVHDARSLHSAENVDLVEHNVLELINNSLHLQNVDSPLVVVYIEEKIIFNSTITGEIRFVSTITNELKFNSTITKILQFNSNIL